MSMNVYASHLTDEVIGNQKETIRNILELVETGDHCERILATRER